MSEMETIDSLTRLDELLASSEDAPLWIFKHSLTCGVSDFALREFLRFTEARPPDARERHCLVEIQRARDVSRAIAERLGVRHESPQALLIDHGEVIWHGSHWAIDRRALAESEALLAAARGAGAPA